MAGAVVHGSKLSINQRAKETAIPGIQALLRCGSAVMGFMRLVVRFSVTTHAVIVLELLKLQGLVTVCTLSQNTVLRRA